MPPQVVEAMQRPMVPHRGPEFSEFYIALIERLKRLHRTEAEVLLWPGSGSAGWEIAAVNLLEPGDVVVAGVTGDFGDRFALVASTFGADVRRVELEWGNAIVPERLDAALRAAPGAKAVLLTHNETSTAVTNPLAELTAVAQEHGALVLVDAVSSAGGIPIEFDAWDVDYLFSGSQKAWMCPPGVAIVVAGRRAWERTRETGTHRFFWDMDRNLEMTKKGWTPTTPPISLLYALDAATAMIEEEGLEAVFDRHRRLGDMTRAGLGQLGLRLLADDAYASNTVTAFFPPDGVEARTIIDRMASEFGITLAGGQAHLASSLIRIGHMGWVDDEDIESCLTALNDVLESV
ncbi:MAG: alanine--glyoxylate aminotransferase family protein [Thermomicrobiales bacterium]|nr:alanine--glyoxylate aminotransferase family protein [Thermomicrobiales bacterium]